MCRPSQQHSLNIIKSAAAGEICSHTVYLILIQQAAAKLLKRGRYTDKTLQTLDPTQIREYVRYSRYSSATNLNPASGKTTPNDAKTGSYSWIKAPRYMNKVHEVGPLARMYINGDYQKRHFSDGPHSRKSF